MCLVRSGVYVRACVRALVRGSIAVGERRVSPLTPEPGFWGQSSV